MSVEIANPVDDGRELMPHCQAGMPAEIVAAYRDFWGRKATLAQPDAEAFVRATKPDYEVAWFHREIFKAMDKLLTGEWPRVMVFAPPGHGKSEIVSRRLPAYALGRHPDWWVLSWSHTADLARDMGLDVQRIMEDESYRALFPNTRIPVIGEKQAGSRRRRSASYFEVVGNTGRYFAKGVGGAIAGKRFHLGLIDDAIATHEDAMSARIRDKVWSEYTSMFAARQFPGARILLTVTRFHVDDLPGRLLRLASDNPNADQFKVLSFPAIK